MKVIIAALGENGLDGLSLGAYKAIKEHYTLFRTGKDEAVQALLSEGVDGETLDNLYETADDFDALGDAIAGKVIEAAQEKGAVVYAVPGGAGIGDATVSAVISLCREKGVAVSFAGGTSPVERAALMAGGLQSAAVFSAYAIEGGDINTRLPLIVTEIDSAILAGELKIKLMDHYPEGCEVLFADENSGNNIPLEDLDRQKKYSHKTKIVIQSVDLLDLSRYDFNRLREVVAVLRQGSDRFEPCPWDAEQTHESLRQDLIEEAYEFADAVDTGDIYSMADELGDVLLHIAMHAQIGAEYGEFSMMDVTSAICGKMISRHRHVFGDVKVADTEQELKLWDELKRSEKNQASVADSMRDVPRAYPALMRSAKVLKRAANVGFNWPDIGACMEKIAEEMDEVLAEVKSGNKERLEEEIGDLLLATAKIPRVLGIDGELALGRAVDKFIGRFAKMEAEVAKSGKNMGDMTIDELDAIWDGIKNK